MDDDSAAYLAIQGLQRAYADIATRRAWDEVPSITTPHARFSFDTRTGNVIEIEGPFEFGEFGARANEHFTFYEYIPLNFVVTIGSDGTAVGRSYSLEVAVDDATGAWLEFYGVYEDEYAQFEGTWRFARANTGRTAAVRTATSNHFRSTQRLARADPVQPSDTALLEMGARVRARGAHVRASWRDQLRTSVPRELPEVLPFSGN